MKPSLVSIFIPVFNGEKYLEATLLAVAKQTYAHFEVLLVDDASTDGSLTILHQFANKDQRFKVFEKENGGMTAVSWNYILPKVQGDFIFYASQDDLFSENLLEEMIKTQQETNADSVIPDLEFYYENQNNSKKIIGINGNRNPILTGKEACLQSLHWKIHGFSMSATQLFKNEFYHEDAFDSDEFITRKILFKSHKVAFSKGIFYYRQDNEDAITKKFGKKNFYQLLTQLRLYNFLVENNFDKKAILETQLELYTTFLDLKTIATFFEFKTNQDKADIVLFLTNFKQNIPSYLLVQNGKFANGKMFLKFGLFFLIYKFRFLFETVIFFKTFLCKSQLHQKYRIT